MLDSLRLASLTRLRGAWAGELSAAVLGEAAAKGSGKARSLEVQRNAIAAALRALRRIAPTASPGGVGPETTASTHLVLLENVGYDCPPRFPFGKLRNLAYKGCTSDFVITLDIDLVPMPTGAAGYIALQRFLLDAASQKVAWVLPAFEVSSLGEAGYAAKGVDTPTSWISTLAGWRKEELRSLVSQRMVTPFLQGGRGKQPGAKSELQAADAQYRFNFSSAYGCTDTTKWLSTLDPPPYSAPHCSGHFEPYVVVPRSSYATVQFDESFVRGFDKASYVYELFAAKFRFKVAPAAFVLHLPGPHELKKGCSNDPVFSVVRPLPEMPGHTCIDAFLQRVQRQYGYAPGGKNTDHAHPTTPKSPAPKGPAPKGPSKAKGKGKGKGPGKSKGKGASPLAAPAGGGFGLVGGLIAGLGLVPQGT